MAHARFPALGPCATCFRIEFDSFVGGYYKFEERWLDIG